MDINLTISSKIPSGHKKLLWYIQSHNGFKSYSFRLDIESQCQSRRCHGLGPSLFLLILWTQVRRMLKAAFETFIYSQISAQIDGAHCSLCRHVSGPGKHYFCIRISRYSRMQHPINSVSLQFLHSLSSQKWEKQEKWSKVNS